MTCQEAEPSDEICRMPQQDCKACGKSTDSCPGCSNACICGKRRTERCGMTCQEAEPLDEHVKCTCNTDCGEFQLSRKKEKSSNDQDTYNKVRSKQEDQRTEHHGKTYHEGKPLNEQDTYNEVRSKQKDSYNDKKTRERMTPPTKKSSKPPDMSLLRDSSQLKVYIPTSEKWATIAKNSGTDEMPQQDYKA